MEIIRGVIQSAQKCVIYGPEGIGKSYLASRFPNPLFSDTEGSTKHMDVARLPNPSSWTMLIQQAQYVKANPNICSTYIVDTADWAERMSKEKICSEASKTGIEDFGYGKGYTYLAEEFGRYLNLLTDIIDRGVHVVLVAHATMRKFEQPDEMGAYDRWEMKLEKKVYPLIKEWADIILFCNYKTIVVNVDGQGATKGTNKVQGGKRVMYTTHHPCWDAKNRHDLLPELPLDWDEIKHIFPVMNIAKTQAIPAVETPTVGTPVMEATPTAPEGTTIPETVKTEPVSNVPKPLADLMEQNRVTIGEIQQVVARRGYYPASTPIENYDPQFIDGVLVGAWGQVFAMIEDMRAEEMPF